MASPQTLSPAWNAALDDYPTALAVSRDGHWLAAGTASGTLYVFDAGSGELRQRVAAHAHGVLSLGFGRNTLASGGQDGQLRLWDAASGNAVATQAAGGAWVQHLAWTADGNRLAFAAGKQVNVCDASGQSLGDFQAPGGVNGLAWNPVGGLLAAVAGGTVSLWRRADRQMDRTLRWPSTLINLAWSHDGKVLACGSLDKSIHFWRAGSWLDSRMGGYARKPASLAWTGDSRWLASTGEDAIVVWNFSGAGPEGSKPLLLQGHVSAPALVVGHPKKPLLLSGAEDRSLALWAPKAGAHLQASARLSAGVAALAFHPAASLAYAAGTDGRVQAFWLDR